MLYAAETWPVRICDVEKLERTQSRMLRWMAGANSWERRTNKSVRGLRTRIDRPGTQEGETTMVWTRRATRT